MMSLCLIGNTAFDDGHIEKLEGWIDTLDSVRSRHVYLFPSVMSTIVSITWVYSLRVTDEKKHTLKM